MLRFAFSELIVFIAFDILGSNLVRLVVLGKIAEVIRDMMLMAVSRGEG